MNHVVLVFLDTKISLGVSKNEHDLDVREVWTMARETLSAVILDHAMVTESRKGVLLAVCDHQVRHSL